MTTPMANNPADPGKSLARRLSPASWPIAIKLGVALVLAALLPMLIVGYINLRASLVEVEKGEAAELQGMARATAGRLDQFIGDSRHLLSYFAWSDEVIGLAAVPPGDDRRRVTEKMNRLLVANADIELLMVLDRNGRVTASSTPAYVGNDLSFRNYFTEAIAGRGSLSHLEIGALSGKPGLYMAEPIRAANGLVAGVAMMKMRGDAVTGIVDAARSADYTAFLVDGDGVIIHHPDARMRYRSLAPLSPETMKAIVDGRRFGQEVIESFDLPALAARLVGAREPGYGDYRSPLDGEEKIVGYAPVQANAWVVSVEEPKTIFMRPLRHLYDYAALTAAIVGALFIVVALLFAQVFLRPIHRLSRAAVAVRAADYDAARVDVASADELGALAATFNDMVDGVRARERERDIFGRVVSPEVRERLLSGQLALGGENRRVAVLFSDIRGFSTLSEKMSPQDVVSLLNDYLTEMADAVRPWGGYINNFIGDAIVVVFGAPEDSADIEWRAVGAALEMKSRLVALNRRRQALDDPPLATGIGISTGKVVAGQVGSLERFLYTVIGDAVNIAARLEAMTKEVDGNPILINGATYEAIRQREGLLVDDLGPLAIKGRVEPVHVYAVRGQDALA